jgi:hypothetical protein
MLTVPIRRPLAKKMLALAESTGLSFAKLPGDMVLVYEGEVQGGYEPGTRLRQSQEDRAAAQGASDAWSPLCVRHP